MRIAGQAMTNTLRAGCHCGGVAFTLPLGCFGVVACHCNDCRTMHGNYNPMLAAPRDAINVLQDETLVWYDSSPEVRRGFCAKCGSRLFKDIHESDHVMVSAGVVAGPVGARIIRNDFEESKGDWYDLPVVEP
jgi:hypothetical protein